MSPPVGFLITWTCYGTWLYGDERGSVDDEHNAYGTASIPADEHRVAALRSKLTHPPFSLNAESRSLVNQTIKEHSLRRGWEILGLNVRSNHVHVVVHFAEIEPEKMMGEWKAWSSRRLRERGLVSAGQPVWTRHGSTRYLWKPKDIGLAVAYVLEGQDSERFGGSEHRARAR